MNKTPNDFYSAICFIFLMIVVGGLIGTVLHYWPMPVNGSVFIPDR